MKGLFLIKRLTNLYYGDKFYNMKNLKIFLFLSFFCSLLHAENCMNNKVIHTVKAGESLSQILSNYGLRPIYGKTGSLSNSSALNNFKNPDFIAVGQQIFLPKECAQLSIQDDRSPVESDKSLSNAFLDTEKVEEQSIGIKKYSVDFGLIDTESRIESENLIASVYSNRRPFANVTIDFGRESSSIYYVFKLDYKSFSFLNSDSIEKSKQAFDVSLYAGKHIDYFSLYAGVITETIPLLYQPDRLTADIIFINSLGPQFGLDYRVPLTSFNSSLQFGLSASVLFLNSNSSTHSTGFGIEPNFKYSYQLNNNQFIQFASQYNYYLFKSSSVASKTTETIYSLGYNYLF